MAAGEYVSVSSQSDTEHADLARETRGTRAERRIRARGTGADLRQARPGDEPGAPGRRSAHGQGSRLAAHARDELGISEMTTARPDPGGTDFGGDLYRRRSDAAADGAGLAGLHAGADGLRCFSALPRFAGRHWRQSGRRRHHSRATARVTFWGALAMMATAGIGKLFGTVV